MNPEQTTPPTPPQPPATPPFTPQPVVEPVVAQPVPSAPQPISISAAPPAQAFPAMTNASPGAQFSSNQAAVLVQHKLPGTGLGILSIVISVLGVGPIGLFLAWRSFKQSRAADVVNRIAIAGIIVGGISTIFVGIVLLSIILAHMQ